MIRQRKLEDWFLRDVTTLLGLDGFKFTTETMNTKVNVSDVVKQNIKQLCEKNKSDRIKYNEEYFPGKSMNPDWSYQVIDKYFSITY